ncbi:hypothetical protein EV715DRAFT_292770 [Schizophyllum commune]
MARTGPLGSTGKWVVGRAQVDIMFNKRMRLNGTPRRGAERLVTQCLASKRVFAYRQIYDYDVNGQLGWQPHHAPPPLVFHDYGRHPPHGAPPPVTVLVPQWRLAPNLNPPLANGAPRPPVAVFAFELRWHHKITATMVHPNRQMHYYPHTRRGNAFLPTIRRPATVKRSFRGLTWSTQVQNWRATF